MKFFSERQGIKPIKSAIQTDSVDDELRNSLWNALYNIYFESWYDDDASETLIYYSMPSKLAKLFRQLWLDYFKRPVDDLQDMNTPAVIKILKNYFFLSCQWYEVYDFIEFVVSSYPYNPANLKFMDDCNSVLERELSAYRFVGGKIVPLISDEEIAEIEESLEVPAPLAPVSNHVQRAVELFADRESPDYRNSIKESISAVEALCKLLTGNPKATLGQALKEIPGLHPALKKAFGSLYGYTSEAEGIRHALLDEPSLEFEDAKFMLVSCSAFINYLVPKASKAGLL